MDGVISDKSAGLYGSFYSIGMIVAPILGSLIYEHFDEIDEHNNIGIIDEEKQVRLAFNKTCDVFAGLTLVYTVLYVLINVLPDIRHDKEQQRAMSAFEERDPGEIEKA